MGIKILKDRQKGLNNSIVNSVKKSRRIRSLGNI